MKITQAGFGSIGEREGKKKSMNLKIDEMRLSSLQNREKEEK